ncbi:MAG: nucleotidyltransferase domain-containing protein [Deltaproteobacteria bacterium]|nr:nucleotidyltransferase domain-containing protein [Deltaproteobacteria bacterium]
MSPEVREALRNLFFGMPEVDAVALFGSAAKGRLGPDSDVDLYVRLKHGARWGSGRRLDLVAEGARLCGREVDLVVDPRGA